MYCNLKGGYIGTTIEAVKGDITSLDYRSCSGNEQEQVDRAAQENPPTRFQICLQRLIVASFVDCTGDSLTAYKTGRDTRSAATLSSRPCTDFAARTNIPFECYEGPGVTTARVGTSRG